MAMMPRKTKETKDPEHLAAISNLVIEKAKKAEIDRKSAELDLAIKEGSRGRARAVLKDRLNY